MKICSYINTLEESDRRKTVEHMKRFMSDHLLSHYLLKFGQLNRATLDGVKAPHKPILLLSIIQSIQCGDFPENKIFITAQLVARFKDNWKGLVAGTAFKPNFALPFLSSAV